MSCAVGFLLVGWECVADALQFCEELSAAGLSGIEDLGWLRCGGWVYLHLLDRMDYHWDLVSLSEIIALFIFIKS